MKSYAHERLKSRVEAALAIAERHVRVGSRRETECRCIGCEMAEALDPTFREGNR